MTKIIAQDVLQGFGETNASLAINKSGHVPALLEAINTAIAITKNPENMSIKLSPWPPVNLRFLRIAQTKIRSMKKVQDFSNSNNVINSTVKLTFETSGISLRAKV